MLCGSLSAQDFFFISNQGNQGPLNFDIYRYNDGRIIPVPSFPNAVEEHPQLSPDGRLLVFSTDAYGPA